MATAVYKVNYQGLRKRESYNEIVDYLENKQEKLIILTALLNK